MSSLFQKLELEAFRAGINPRTQQSRDWFRRRVQRLTRINRDALMREDEVNKRASHSYGSMFMYFYDPKHKKKLPYYDRFPLIFKVQNSPGGFEGLNLHYLPPILRAQFLDALMDNVTSKKSEDAKFELTVKLLASTSSLEFYKPCIKHYLNEHVKSKFAEVKAPEWEIATFLPTAQFEKADKRKIYADSRRMLR